MTHPMQPTPEQCAELWGHAYGATRDDSWQATGFHVARLAYAAGADAELEACCEWLRSEGLFSATRDLRAVRRPKSLTTRELALLQVQELIRNGVHESSVDIIRNALELLPDESMEAQR